MRFTHFYVYIMTNKSDRVLYTGMTNNLERRVFEHKHRIVEGFTKKYNVDKLVWYETFPDATTAIATEKKIKGWLRARKIALIIVSNPGWTDLSEEWKLS